MTASKERSPAPLQILLELIGRSDLVDYYRCRRSEAGLATSAAARALLHHHDPDTHRQPLSVTSLKGKEVERLFLRVSEVLITAPGFSRNTELIEPLSLIRQKLMSERVDTKLPADWEALFSVLQASQKDLGSEFMVALDAAFGARALGDNAPERPERQDKIPAELMQFIRIEDPPGQMLGVKEAAELLGVSRPTIYGWMRSGTLIGWPRGTVRGHVIPAEQILGPGRVVPGLEEISQVIEKPQLAWDFLSRPWPFRDREQRPIERLRSGDEDLVQSVLDAAPAYGDSST